MKNKRVPRAGLIPYIIEDNIVKMMLMKPSNPKYGGNQFQIAKGKVDEGEISIDAATREANEELGLTKENCGEVLLLGTYMRYTDVYFTRVNSSAPSHFIDTTYETGETIWYTFDEFYKNGRSIHIPIIRDLEAILTLMPIFD
jgi:8-oxo-dGTP pyrophosphatase MutT (NUDIX family)